MAGRNEYDFLKYMYIWVWKKSEKFKSSNFEKREKNLFLPPSPPPTPLNEAFYNFETHIIERKD